MRKEKHASDALALSLIAAASFSFAGLVGEISRDFWFFFIGCGVWASVCTGFKVFLMLRRQGPVTGEAADDHK